MYPSKSFHLPTTLHQFLVELVSIWVQREWESSQLGDGACSTKFRQRKIDFACTEFCAIPVNILGSQPEDLVAMTILPIRRLERLHGSFVTILSSVDQLGRLEDGP